MTFEDFKTHFEQFSKIDTAEKLAICQNQYEKHILHIEDEQFFEPQKLSLSHYITSKYEKNLNNIFHFDKIQDNQIYFLVRPSFKPETLLIIEKQEAAYTLTLVVLTKNYWTLFYTDNNVTDVEKTTSKSELNKVIGDKLFNLLDKTIIDARAPKASFFTLDGVVYWLSKLSNGQQKIVSKHSPSEMSKSGQIIEIMEQLIDNIENLGDIVLSNLNSKIADLQD